MADTKSKTTKNAFSGPQSLRRTTPFPAVAGSPVTKTDDKYYCRACYCVDFADLIEDADHISCPECDSVDVIPLAQKQREDARERFEELAECDRIADERRSSLSVLL